MKILLANGSAYPTIGGVENSLRFIGRELLHSGHEVKILCLRTSPNTPSRMEHEGMEIIRISCPSKRWPHARLLSTVRAVQQECSAILDAFQPDAVWSRSVPVGLGIRQSGYQGPLLQIFCTNTKMDCRGQYLQTFQYSLKRRLKLLGLWASLYFVSARLERDLARQCIAVAFSNNMRRQLLKSFPQDARSCHVIPPGVDTKVFSFQNGRKYFETIERDYGLCRNEPFVLYVGRLSNAKHIPMLIDAVCSLEARVKLVLVGSGPEEMRLRQYAEQLGLADRVVFAGVHHEMLPCFYTMSRVCVLPTTIESFGQVYLESLACGTPAVGFGGDDRHVLTATGEIIQDGKTGGVVNKISAQALAMKIDSILSLDDKDYAAMSQLAREDVVLRFSWQRFVADTLRLSTPTPQT